MEISQEAKEAIRKYAVKNAHDYGKASESTVLNKMLALMPGLKGSINALSAAVKEIVSEVNALDTAALEREFGKYKEEFEEADAARAKRTAKPKFELDGAAAGKFATRFPPEPNGYMQIGHAKVAWLERTFADIYKGTLALYFDDTNPDTEKQEFVDAFKKDLEWLGISFDLEYYASDNLPALYGYAEKMIEMGGAYVCMCGKDEVKNGRAAGTACLHRNSSKAENLALWKRMLGNEFEENGAMLRFRGDMKSENTVMRDPVLFRVKLHEHYRQSSKYVVWPTYNFNTPVIDSIKGITDAIRSKEYELRDELYYRILDMLELRKPRIRSVARLEISNNQTSKRKINALIAQHLIWGYDDPRLVTIAALRRRGIRPGAIKEFVLRFGMSKVNSKVSIEMLLTENRKLIDSSTRRLFFVGDPVEVRIDGAMETHVRLKLHPSAELGAREYDVKDRVYISRGDAKELRKGEKLRLKDLYNIEIVETGDKIKAKMVNDVKNYPKKIQWVLPDSINAKLYIPMPPFNSDGEFNKGSMKTVEGYVEYYAKDLNEGDVIQFERVGFFRLDSKAKMSFIGL